MIVGKTRGSTSAGSAIFLHELDAHAKACIGARDSLLELLDEAYDYFCDKADTTSTDQPNQEMRLAAAIDKVRAELRRDNGDA